MDAKIQVRCEGCGATVIFPASDIGTVQECSECGGFLDVPEITRVPTVYDQHTAWYERSMEETKRQQQQARQQLDDIDRQQQRWRQQLDRRDRLDAVAEQMLERVSRLLDRWQGLADRLDQALSMRDRRNQPKPEE